MKNIDMCPECNGRGVISYTVYSTEGDVRETCTWCLGTGFVDDERKEYFNRKEKENETNDEIHTSSEE